MTEQISDFGTLGVNATLVAQLHALGIEKPTPIQAEAIPAIASGRDIMGLAQTGTGKTAAYLLPLIQEIMDNPPPKGVRRPRVLILAPTRELAHQVSNNLRDFCRGVTLRYLTICGGERYKGQIFALKKGVDVLVATPGRFEDLQEKGLIDLSDIKHVILDEADQMIDLGFYPAIKRICAGVPMPRQMLFFSATMPKEMQELADEFLDNVRNIRIKSKNITADTVDQRASLVSERKKRDKLEELIAEAGGEQVLIFAGTKRRVEMLTEYLAHQDIAVDMLHGDMRQLIRTKVLRNFKAGRLQVLVATDVAARGIDVSGLNWVINFDLPQLPEVYVHRIGRTGRAEQKGVAISLCAPGQQSQLKAIRKHVKGVIALYNANGDMVEAEDLKSEPSGNNRRARGGRGGSFRQNRSGGRDGGRGGARRDGAGRDGPGPRGERSGPKGERRRSRDDGMWQGRRSGWSPAEQDDRPAKRKSKFKKKDNAAQRPHGVFGRDDVERGDVDRDRAGFGGKKKRFKEREERPYAQRPDRDRSDRERSDRDRSFEDRAGRNQRRGDDFERGAKPDRSKARSKAGSKAGSKGGPKAGPKAGQGDKPTSRSFKTSAGKNSSGKNSAGKNSTGKNSAVKNTGAKGGSAPLKRRK